MVVADRSTTSQCNAWHDRCSSSFDIPFEELCANTSPNIRYQFHVSWWNWEVSKSLAASFERFVCHFTRYGVIWMSNLNFLCELTFEIPQLPCHFRMAKAVSSTITGKNDHTWLLNHRQAVCGPVMHSIFDASHYEVLWTWEWMRTVLYQLYMMTRNCPRFYETWESQRRDAWGQFFLTCNAMEHGRAGGIMPLVKYFLHIELLIWREPGLMALGRDFLPIMLWIAGEPWLMPLVKYFYISSYGSWMSQRAVTSGRIYTDQAMKRGKVRAIGLLMPSGDSTCSYLSSSSSSSTSSTLSFSSSLSTLAFRFVRYSSGQAASPSVCMTPTASGGLGQKQ